ncbi:MAG: zinc ribbon domain-containing protein [Ruminococcus sp.]|nr:zinc ribbon domain-containing protein [Ruminococcus sp.]
MKGIVKKLFGNKKKSFCTCGAVLEEDAEFCMECGAPVVRAHDEIIFSSRPCPNPNCGALLEEGAEYCMECGTYVGMGTDTVQPVCAFCGEPLEEGADFCIGCGQRVSDPVKVSYPPSKNCMHCSMPVDADTVWCPFCGKKAFESDVVPPVTPVTPVRCIHCFNRVDEDTVWCPFCGKKAFESEIISDPGLIDTTTHGNTPSDEEIDAAQKNFHKPPTL